MYRRGTGKKYLIVKQMLESGERNRDVIAEKAGATVAYVYTLAKKLGYVTHKTHEQRQLVLGGFRPESEKAKQAKAIFRTLIKDVSHENEREVTAIIKKVRLSVGIADKTAEEILGEVYLEYIEGEKKPVIKRENTVVSCAFGMCVTRPGYKRGFWKGE